MNGGERDVGATVAEGGKFEGLFFLFLIPSTTIASFIDA